MNRGILISLVIIFVLAVYILVSRLGPGSDTLRLPELEGKPDTIAIQVGDGQEKILKKREKGWIIEPGGYPADSGTVQQMIKKLEGLQRLELVSRKKYYDRYGLTPEKRVRVGLRAEGGDLMTLMIGKTSFTGRHTYLLYDDRELVYQAPGNLRSMFSKSVEELRDKTVMNIDVAGIKGFVVEKGNLSYSFNRVEGEKAVKESAPGKDEKKGKPYHWEVEGFEYAEFDTNRVESLLRRLRPLRAEGYPETDVSKEEYEGKVTLQTARGEVTLTFHKQTEEGDWVATASTTPYVFTVSSFTAESFMMENVEKLKKKQDKGE
jgi:hypothetical protein